jgi:hypothetical protein
VRAAYFLVAALAPKMAANGGGSIVNVASMVAGIGIAGTAAYGGTKASGDTPSPARDETPHLTRRELDSSVDEDRRRGATRKDPLFGGRNCVTE